MASQAEHYRTQARIMLDQAEDAVLANVRERCLRSAAAWTDMAERAERHEQSRARSEALRAAALLENCVPNGG